MRLNKSNLIFLFSCGAFFHMNAQIASDTIRKGSPSSANIIFFNKSSSIADSTLMAKTIGAIHDSNSAMLINSIDSINLTEPVIIQQKKTKKTKSNK
jgi:hypothetical protein